MKAKHSIRWRLSFSYLGLSLVTVAIMGLLARTLVNQYVSAREMSYLTNQSIYTSQQALPMMQAGGKPDELASLAEEMARTGAVHVKISDADGQIIADVDPHWMYVQTSPAASEEASSASQTLSSLPFVGLDGAPAEGKRPKPGTIAVRFPDSETMTKVEMPVGDPKNPLGYVEVSQGPRSVFLAEAQKDFYTALFLAGLLSVGASLLLGLLVSGYLIRPLKTLTESVDKMSSGDLTKRVHLASEDEVGHLAAHFNQMADRLQASFKELSEDREALRRFISDASHELRTPITALKTFNELLLSGEAENPQTRLEFLTESQAQLERLQWITKNLLDLSRLESGVAKLDLEYCDAGEILDGIEKTFQPAAQKLHLNLVCKPPITSCKFWCDRTRLELALINLVDNAFKFTPEGGTVELGVKDNQAKVCFWVKDDGTGIHPDDLPYIFDRFYRGHRQERQGNGLGLAIVKSIAQVHAGQISVESIYGEGSCFEISLPHRLDAVKKEEKAEKRSTF